MKSISLTENEISHIKELYSQELERLQKRSNEISSILTKLKGPEDAETPAKETKAIQKQDKVLKKTSKTLKENTKAQSSAKIAKVEKNDIRKEAEKPKAKRGRPFAKKAEVKLETIAKGKRGRKPKAKELVAVEPLKAKKAITVVKTAKAEKLAKPAKVKKEVAKSETPAKRGRKKSINSKKSRWTVSILEILEKEGKVLTSREILNQIMTIQKIPVADLGKTRSTVTGSLSDLKLETKRVKSISIPGQKAELYGLAQWFNEAGNLLDQSRR